MDSTQRTDTTKPSAKTRARRPKEPRGPADGPATALLEESISAAKHACDWIMAKQHADGHWCAELESNATITAEYVFMCQALGIDIKARAGKIGRYFRSQQKEDGSWGIAFNLDGDVSTTVEVYLALRILGVGAGDEALMRAEEFIRAHGGVAAVRIFTRINLAAFGLFPWEAIPVIPPEFIFLPHESPVNVYSLSSWARSTMVPLFIIFHHKPVFALPNGMSAGNDWLDHLWLDPTDKNVPYAPNWLESLQTDGVGYRSFFTAADAALRGLEKARAAAKTHPLFTKAKVFAGQLPVLGPLVAPALETSVREIAVKKCEEWILRRQEDSGDWAGIFPPMVNGIIALTLNGHGLDSDPVRRGLEAIERFAIDDAEGFRVQACVSPVWDTVLVMRGLGDCGFDLHAERLEAARHWVEGKQLLVDHGDWKVYNPNGVSGGWSFEYENSWYPDIDDTAAVMIAFLKQHPESGNDAVLQRAAQWIVSMQNRDGGWGAFDKDNDKLFLNQIPFSDMDSLCDPSSPDVTGRVLEAFGMLDDPRYKYSVEKGLEYIRKSQEPEGSWYGRWGVNYVYGTSNVLCALGEQAIPGEDTMVKKAIAWLKSRQNEDGGWGERLESYSDRSLMGVGPSTASQTAWAVMGLLAYLPAADEAVQRGVRWLVDRQVKDGDLRGAWEEREFTGTGFPNHFYLRYHYYRHFFPMMALGRFVAKQTQ